MSGFADEVTIQVASGKGGDGCLSFRREKYVPRGGPDGGDGGRGGNVVFEVKKNVKTLAHLRHTPRFAAEDGQPGKGRKKHGRDGRDAVISVPPGTLIKDPATGEVLYDFSPPARQAGRLLAVHDTDGLDQTDTASSADGNPHEHLHDHPHEKFHDQLHDYTTHELSAETCVFLKGGRGGKGNTHFASATHQAPRFAQPGAPGKEMTVLVELRLIADIGFVGLPNAGKSSLLRYVTNAHPKVGDYPFTTTEPNLGVMHAGFQDIILADIPGIIQGASQGAGMGHTFLRHITRTAGLAFLMDVHNENPAEDFKILLDELQAYSPRLAAKERIVVATKLDLDPEGEAFGNLKSALPSETVIGISVFARTGLDELKYAFIKLLEKSNVYTHEAQKNRKER